MRVVRRGQVTGEKRHFVFYFVHKTKKTILLTFFSKTEFHLAATVVRLAVGVMGAFVVVVVVVAGGSPLACIVAERTIVIIIMTKQTTATPIILLRTL